VAAQMEAVAAGHAQPHPLLRRVIHRRAGLIEADLAGGGERAEFGDGRSGLLGGFRDRDRERLGNLAGRLWVLVLGENDRRLQALGTGTSPCAAIGATTIKPSTTCELFNSLRSKRNRRLPEGLPLGLASALAPAGDAVMRQSLDHPAQAADRGEPIPDHCRHIR
jgi:hypothetical protein